jgi:hypothetical protein
MPRYLDNVIYYRQVIAYGKSKNPKAREIVLARVRRDLWNAREREAAHELIQQAAKDCSVCTTCAAPIGPKQSVTLRRHDIGKHHPSFAWAPECSICTLTRMSVSDSYNRFRCQVCERPLRIAATNRAAVAPVCCELCQRLYRNWRNNMRLRAGIGMCASAISFREPFGRF